ncbi:hypothetical protein [Bradyrhizobium sp. 2TAF24]|uniref:hypothetical protein n=1 Tax=Bradyrhizobium sp. 2TAF24 TaxID=3233011 RepID=UPI003F92CBBF
MTSSDARCPSTFSVMRGLDPRIQLLSFTKLDHRVSALTRRPGDDGEWGEAPCLIGISRSSAA